ncbi:uncharacterized protein LOC132887367 isoform X2 [Neoarius graeffei]|nr:uncharacterized protein LOC132887367 isoform X2 [Neoarius graeffei]
MDHFALKVMDGDKVLKLLLPSIPSSLEQLMVAVKELCCCTEDISLKYLDSDFEDFFDLSSPTQIKHKDTIRVVRPTYITLNMQNISNDDLSFLDDSTSSAAPNSPDDAHSIASQDTILLSPSSSPERAPWPKHFPIPVFCYEAEMMLQRGNEAFKKDGSRLTNPSVKTAVLDGLSRAIFQYTAYPSGLQIAAVAEELVKKHPCLRDASSYTGYSSWQYSIKYKMGNYRMKLRTMDIPEVTCNSLKHKVPGERKPAKNVKKAKKSEVNYLPPLPGKETMDTQEIARKELLAEAKKKDNARAINELMTITFPYRRHEVVNLCPRAEEMLDRWPALFQTSQINEEFRQLTTKTLEPKFMAMLDNYTPRLLGLFQSKGGALGERLKANMSRLFEDPNNIDLRREVVILSLIDYLGEEKKALIKEYHSEDLAQEDQQVMKICVVADEVGIVLEGVRVMRGLGNIASACSALLGLTYALNLSYPKELKHTFETFQKIFLEVEEGKLSGKLHSLKNKLK